MNAGQSPTILVVEDEPAIERLLGLLLKKEGYRVANARCVRDAKSCLSQSLYDAVILDRKLPDGDGLELCLFIRNRADLNDLPILFLSQKNSTAEKVLGLKVGGDDYLAKPFDNLELVVRLGALLRRRESHYTNEKVIELGRLRLDLSKHECFIADETIQLRPKEFELLKLLLNCKNRVLNKHFLSEHVWGTPYLSSSRAIDTTVQRLRQQLGVYGHAVETVRSYGYRLNADRFEPEITPNDS